MPLKNIDYSKIVIYKIQHIEKEDLIYIGSTTNFKIRKATHKFNSKELNLKYADSKFKLYDIIRKNGGWDMFKMLEVKKFPCLDFNEARAEEDKIYLEFNATMNSRRPKKNIEDCRKNKNDKNKIRYPLIKDTQNEKRRLKYLLDDDFKSSSLRINLQYRIANREKIRERANKKISCPCGKSSSSANMKRHYKSIHHLNYESKVTILS
tara:strand:- start:244 stop:867 length:624 start_codon:yes stop_codon:yes gene_type:complete